MLEQGNNLDIAFTIPPLTTEGLPLKEIGERGVARRSQPHQRIQRCANGRRASTRVDVPDAGQAGSRAGVIPVSKFVGNEVMVAVRVTNPKGRDAGWSDPKIFACEAAARRPHQLSCGGRTEGRRAHLDRFRLQANFASFAKAGNRASQKPVLLATATEPNYIDISAEFGKTYQYSIQAVRGKMSRAIWWGRKPLRPRIYSHRRFLPGLTASIGMGAVELAWNRNTESNFKEYRVLRSEEGGPFVEIARGLDAPVYSDHAIQSGKHYRYEV